MDNINKDIQTLVEQNRKLLITVDLLIKVKVKINMKKYLKGCPFNQKQI